MVYLAIVDGGHDVYSNEIKPNASGSDSSSHDANHADSVLGYVLFLPCWFGVVLVG